MGTTRRLFLGAGVGAIVAGGGWVWSRSIETELRAILHRNFGKTIANAPDAELFIEEFAALWRDETSLRNQSYRPRFWSLALWSDKAKTERAALEENVLELFLRATNAVRAQEDGQDLAYLGMPHPYENLCANPLSSNWL